MERRIHEPTVGAIQHKRTTTKIKESKDGLRKKKSRDDPFLGRHTQLTAIASFAILGFVLGFVLGFA